MAAKHPVLASLGAAVTAGVGVLVVLGCLLALYLELEGFGRQSDTGVRPLYVASLIAGIVAGIGVPAASIAMLRPEARGAVVVAASVTTFLVAIGVLGITLFR